ncbi:MAG: ion channel [Candidatus Korobacteraceae bacterium]|jgi:inward rectifier potassium channel
MPEQLPKQQNGYLYQQESSDLGFGSVVSNEPGFRLLNRDGSFNVVKPAARWLQSSASYHRMLTMSWPKFLAILLAGYLAANLVFACIFYLLGPQAMAGDIHTSEFLRAFFFSIDTLATLGSGSVAPVGVVANAVVGVEALVGLLAFAMAAGLIFARFSRPVADIAFSNHALIAPYRDITAFEFRIVNARENQLIDVRARVVFSRFETAYGRRQRLFTPLLLEREGVTFLPLNWTVVHPIDRASPLFGWTEERLLAAEAEFLILLTAIDETFAQTVHSRSSYIASEVVWGASFAPMYRNAGGAMELDLSRLDQLKPRPSQAAADD